MATGTGRMVLALLLFASGAAALVYQILWIKQLSLVVGVDVHAVTTGVSAFFAGLALGGVLFGRWADRLPRPFLLYAFLELGVAVSASPQRSCWRALRSPSRRWRSSWSPGLGAALRACRPCRRS